jgi:L-threonylcarbamoyladenylate synthase
MRRVKLQDDKVVEIAVAALRADGVAVLPTDTIYGFSTILTSREGFERVVAIKRSGGGRRFVYLASSIDMVSLFIGGWGSGSKEELRGIWPASLTVVLPSGPEVPSWVGETIALRVPDSNTLRAIIEAVGEPILSTSVNRAGEAARLTADSIEDDFGDEIDLIVVEDAEEGSVPSTIVDLTGAEPKVVRQGAYAWRGRGNPSNSRSL